MTCPTSPIAGAPGLFVAHVLYGPLPDGTIAEKVFVVGCDQRNPEIASQVELETRIGAWLAALKADYGIKS